MKKLALLAALAMCGVASGCAEERVIAPAPPLAAAVTLGATAPPQVPAGWRDMKFGMSESDAKQVVDGYRKSPTEPWERTDAIPLPTVRLAVERIDNVLVDRERFHHWSTRDLDDGTESLHAWHDRGKLVALLLTARTSATVFLANAREAYGAPPKEARFGFLDDRSRMEEKRTIAFWRGIDATALIWRDGSSPTLLLWSNPSMDARAIEYQTSMDETEATARASRAAREAAMKL